MSREGGLTLLMTKGFSSKLLKLTKDVYRPKVDSEVEVLKELAKLNKLYLPFLRVLKDIYPVELEREEERFKLYMLNTIEIVKALNELNYALFKFRRPVDHVSVDLDILVDTNEVWKAVSKLRRNGFSIDVIEPYTVTLVRKNFIVDLYTHPAFAWMVYLNGEKLLDEVEDIEIEGISARALTREAEAVVSAAHAIYKEEMVLLIDCLTIGEWVNSNTRKIAKEHKATKALDVAMEACKLIEEGLAEAPYRLPKHIVFKLYLEKALNDPDTRGTIFNILRYTTRRDFGRRLLWRITRVSY